MSVGRTNVMSGDALEQDCHGTGKLGKIGNFEFHFSRQGKQRELAKNIKNLLVFFPHEVNLKYSEILKFQTLKGVVGMCFDVSLII